MRTLTFLLLLLLGTVAVAEPAKIADPTVWHVKGPAGDVYLLGSVHLLPPEVNWLSPKVAAAITASDVFVFEVPLDAQSATSIQALVAEKGILPEGQTLRELLHPAYRKEYDTAVLASGINPSVLAHERPWLAGLQMMLAQVTRLKFDPSNGPDTVLTHQAEQSHKAVRYLETMEDQLAVLVPSDSELDRDEFEADLGELKDVQQDIQPVVDAWSAGDQKKLDELINGDLDKFPAMRKMLLDDRNARWLPQIEAMLTERHTFLITVGAGHLMGPKGIPALLRNAGYHVDGP